MDLKDRGHGLIFLDHQPVNIHNYQAFTSALMTDYEVSRTAVSIRLKRLGLLNDQLGYSEGRSTFPYSGLRP